MKGFILQVGNENISGAIENGSTSITVTCKDDKFRLNFGSMNSTGMLSYTWYASDLEVGDCLNVCFQDINNVSETQETRDYNNSQQMDSLALESYYKLKKELQEEGLL